MRDLKFGVVLPLYEDIETGRGTDGTSCAPWGGWPRT